ncbi:13581_t:CDS:2 [Dentiscutata erythropus]|uniref:13581_t:CDS:1 n=1 Tax=Dentiscutata erythropus TaxID=1348616 RepID=A0A9N9NYD5_9GLOM|nr:13581_t:CDS:2 [Dentiscutata erythropus]
MSDNPQNIEINIDEPQNDTIQPSAQNNTTLESSNHLGPSFIPINELPVCDIEYSDLKITEYIAEGGFGKVHKAQWRGRLVAAKFVSRRERRQLKDFNRELATLKKSNGCEDHIIQYFGLSKGSVFGEYILVMQYADDGTLKDYLKCRTNTDTNTRELTLDQKIDLCKDILKGLEFLHNKGTSVVRGIAPYVDPKLFCIPGYLHKISSDIYSFGVLMWEIYTCLPPFGGRRDALLAIDLCLGAREKPKAGMPEDYVKIYEKCWNPDPPSRPDATSALNDLEILKKTLTATNEPPDHSNALHYNHGTINLFSDLLLNISLNHSNNNSDLKKKIIESIKTQYVDSANKMLLPLKEDSKETISGQKFDKVCKLKKISRKSYDNVPFNKMMHDYCNQQRELKGENATTINNACINNEVECSNKSQKPKELYESQETRDKIETTKRTNNLFRKNIFIIFIIFTTVGLFLFGRELFIYKKQDQYDKLSFALNDLIEILEADDEVKYLEKTS